MTSLLIALLVVMAISVIASAALYARQQILQQRVAQRKALLRRSRDYEKAFDLIMRVDDSSALAIVILHAVADIQSALLANRDPSALTRIAQIKAQITALRNGSRKPGGELVVTSDSEIALVLEELRTLGNKLMRLKIKGSLDSDSYTLHLGHVERLKTEIQTRSHTQFGESLLEAGKRRPAIAHLRKARDAYKRSSLNGEIKTEAVRKLTERIKQIESNADLATVATLAGDTVGVDTLDIAIDIERPEA